MAHGVQTDAPMVAEKEPDEQGSQPTLPLPAAAVPGLHGCGTERPLTLARCPGGTGTHTLEEVAPTAVDVVPRSHWEHEDAPTESE